MAIVDVDRHRRRTNIFDMILTGLRRIGIAFGPLQLLAVRGRRGGRLLTFLIAVNELSGGRYIVQAFPKAPWVANVRVADAVTLTQGGRPRPVFG
ncbi:hypothetical protein [Nocardia gipuzkoensis]